MTFGTKLRQIRERKRLSQQEVADFIGVGQNTYSRWESDQNKFDVTFLTKLAEKFEVDLIELIPNGTTVKIVNNTDNKDTSVNAFEVNMDAKVL